MATFLEKLKAIRAIWDEDEIEHTVEAMRRDQEGNPSARLVLTIADEVMKAVRENFIPSSDKVDAFFPRHYIVFMGPDDEQYTRGERLAHIKGRVVEEVYKRLRTKRIDHRRLPETISLEIRIDANAGVGQVRAMAEDDPANARSTPYLVVREERLTEEDLSQSKEIRFFLQVFLNGNLEQEVAIQPGELTIGRGRNAGIQLEDIDPRIAREHCKIVRGPDLVITALNDNPTVVNGRVLKRNESLELIDGDGILIYGYELRCRILNS